MRLFDLFKRKLFKKKPQTTGNYLVDFYNRIDEDSRLLSKCGQIEFMTTVKYIDKYLQKGMKIIEIGAATGRYSHHFARKGFTVEAVELIEHNIEIFKANTLPNEKINIRQGNAVDLSFYPDNSFDVTLLLGPMYHLYTVEEQKKALSEAQRITKNGGYIFVAYCMLDPSVLTRAFAENRLQEFIDTDLINIDTFETFFPPHGVFKLYTRDEIFELTKALKAERLHFVATDGYAPHMNKSVEKMDKFTYETYLKYHFKNCERQDLIGMSPHTLDVLKKE
ncbi:MAG: class I SAM-dependent methyltransferase [Clostridia bacterium]|nr:class I SAM-dependent methyltransferase [Clostridia bacterium]